MCCSNAGWHRRHLQARPQGGGKIQSTHLETKTFVWPTWGRKRNSSWFSHCYKKKQLPGFTEQFLSVWHVCSARNEPQAQYIFITQHSIWAFFHIHVTLHYVIWGVQPVICGGVSLICARVRRESWTSKSPPSKPGDFPWCGWLVGFECGFIFIVLWWFSNFRSAHKLFFHPLIFTIWRFEVNFGPCGSNMSSFSVVMIRPQSNRCENDLFSGYFDIASGSFKVFWLSIYISRFVQKILNPNFELDRAAFKRLFSLFTNVGIHTLVGPVDISVCLYVQFTDSAGLDCKTRIFNNLAWS